MIIIHTFSLFRGLIQALFIILNLIAIRLNHSLMNE